MNLYNVTLWDDTAGKDKKGASVHLTLVAKDDVSALNAAKTYHGEITRFNLQQSDVIVVK